MKIHELKCWPEYFAKILDGSKRFELRNDDRGFEVGDRLWLREYDPHADSYSGRETTVLVTYHLLIGPLYSNGEFCIMSIAPVETTREKQLEDALRELVDSFTDGYRLKLELHSDSKETLQRVAKALVDARELLGKASR